MIAVGSKRGWLTERLRFLLLSLSRARASSYLPFEYLVFGFLAPLCLSVRSPSAAAALSEAEAADPSIGRNIIPSYLSLIGFDRGVHRHAFRSIRKTRPADRRTVAHSHGLPLRGISSRTVFGPRYRTSRANARAHATAADRRVCVRVYLALVDLIPCSFAAYNKLATRARIMPSYWK